MQRPTSATAHPHCHSQARRSSHLIAAGYCLTSSALVPSRQRRPSPATAPWAGCLQARARSSRAASPAVPQAISGTNYYPYQITLTNNGSSTADITGWAVAFYDSSGTELGSDEQGISDEFLTSSQSFTWTRYAPDDTAGDTQSLT